MPHTLGQVHSDNTTNRVTCPNSSVPTFRGRTALGELGQLRSVAELRQRELRLRIFHYEILLRFTDAEQRDVDLVMDHRLDELGILREGLFVDPDLLGLQEVLEIGEHRVVDDEPAGEALLALRRRAQPGVAFRREPLRIILERGVSDQPATKARGVETVYRADKKLVRLDAAAAVNLAARIRVLELRRVVLARPRLLAQRVGQVLVE